MEGNGRGTTVHHRINECLALASCIQPGEQREGYLAEATGMEDANAGLPAKPEKYATEHERREYLRGYQDAVILLRISKGVQP